MRLGKLAQGAAMAVLLTASGAAAAETVRLTPQPSSKLWLTGDSTLHPYASTATAMDLVLEASSEKPNAQISKLILDRKVSKLELTIPVKGLKSGEKGLDKNMYAALKADKNPDILFRMSGYEASVSTASAQGGIAVRVKGTLTITGTSRDVELEALAKETPEGIHLAGGKALNMSDFGVKPPKLFFGALKVKDAVVIHYDLLLAAVGRGKTDNKGEKP